MTFAFPQGSLSRDAARSSFGAIALAMMIALTSLPLPGCRAPVVDRESNGSASQPSAGNLLASAPSLASQTPGRDSRAARHDLSVDEAMGGHTLARHVGKTNEELIERLRREPDISSASTYNDRGTAERVIDAALASRAPSFQKWRGRQGRRPNFVLHYDADEPIGRLIRRGRTRAVSCERAVVVLRWDDRRQQFYVLTSYPEENR